VTKESDFSTRTLKAPVAVWATETRCGAFCTFIRGHGEDGHYCKLFGSLITGMVRLPECIDAEVKG